MKYLNYIRVILRINPITGDSLNFFTLQGTPLGGALGACAPSVLFFSVHTPYVRIVRFRIFPTKYFLSSRKYSKTPVYIHLECGHLYGLKYPLVSVMESLQVEVEEGGGSRLPILCGQREILQTLRLQADDVGMKCQSCQLVMRGYDEHSAMHDMW